MSDHYDWFPKPLTMRSHSRGEIVHLPYDAIDFGSAAGHLIKINKPEGFKVDKSGRVIRCHS